jgi:hypothetical protein
MLKFEDNFLPFGGPALGVAQSLPVGERLVGARLAWGDGLFGRAVNFHEYFCTTQSIDLNLLAS